MAQSMSQQIRVILLEKCRHDSDFIKGFLAVSGSSASPIQLKVARTPLETASLAGLERPDVLLLSIASFDDAVPDGLAAMLAPSPATAVVLLYERGQRWDEADFSLPGVQDVLSKDPLQLEGLQRTLLNASRLGRARSQLREKKEILKALFSASADGIISFSPVQRALEVNPAACRILGASERELLGRTAEEIFFKSTEPEKRGRAADFLMQTFEDGVRRSVDRVCFSASGEHSLWVQCTLQPIHEGARQGAVIAVFKSLSDAIQKEEKLKDAIQEQFRNEQRLVEALSELKKLNQQLKETQDQLIQAEKLQSVGRLAAGVAHEVKNPLAIIMQGAEYLKHSLARENEGIEGVIEDVLDAVRRADGVIQGLLDFSSPADAEMAEGDLAEVIDEALRLVKHVTMAHKVRVVKKIPQDLKPVFFDRNRIQHVFVNLFSNALYAMKEGGELTVCARSEAEDLQSKPCICAEILDTGSGIDPELLDKIFDPFVTTRRGRGGTGLGLSVVKGIMDLHSGHIKIENREDCKGTKVTLRF
ncbi:MAG: PAS domain S-box protein [Candidatus Omnitrophica bacterium]|nr:PAS domain S-box protein [Candidatus Omnitrophota bacterium]